ncbi:MAG TPA: ACT domain-containing protein [Rhodocyclaceae bacterium]
MSRQSLILTVIADDRPGLVGELSAAVSAHKGNWLESSLAQLAGKFAGIVRVEVDEVDAGSLQATVERLPNLRVSVTRAGTAAAPAGRRLTLELVGNDRVGIVKEVTAVLARHSVNVEKLETRTESGPMAAGMLFRAEADLTAPAALDARTLKGDLEAISHDLMVEIVLGERM